MRFFSKLKILVIMKTIALILLLSAPNMASSKNESIKSTPRNVRSTEIESLIKQLKNRDFNQRITAQISLIDIGPDTIPFLGEALLGKNEIVACSSAKILGELGAQGIPPLIRFLKDPNYIFQNLPRHTSVISALNRIGPEVIPSIMDICFLENDYHPMSFNEFSKLIKNFKTSATPYLIEKLSDESPIVRHFTLLILKHIKDESAIPAAIGLLNDENEAVKIEAAWTLAFLGSNAKSALPALIECLKHESDNLPELKEPFTWWRYKSFKSEVVQAITRIDNEKDKAVNDILQLLNDNDPLVRKFAVIYLRDTKKDKKELIKKIVDSLKDPNVDVRAESAKALSKLNDDSDIIKNSLLKTLDDPYGTVRKEALESIIQIGKIEDYVFDAVFNALNDEDPIVQIRALSETHRFNSKTDKFVPVLIKKTKDNNIEVKRQAVIALGRLDLSEEEIIDSLIYCLNDNNVVVRAAAIDTIKRIGSAAHAAIPQLKRIILTDVQSLRNPAFNALQSIGFEASPTLFEFLESASFEIRSQSAKTIGDVKPKIQSAVPYLVDLFMTDENSDVRQAAAISLGKIGTVVNEAIPIICDALEKASYAELSSAFQAIRAIGPKAKCAIPKLINFLNNQDPYIRKDAANTIAVFGPEASDAIPILINIIKVRDFFCTTEAIRSLGKMGSKASSAVSELINLIRGEDKRYKEEAIRTLGKLGLLSAPAIPDIIKIFNDKASGFKEICAKALVQIATDARDNGSTNLISRIKEIEVAFLKNPDFSSPTHENNKHLKEVRRAREFLELSIKKPLSERIGELHSKVPWPILILIYPLFFYFIWILVPIFLWWIFPISIVKIHKAFDEIELRTPKWIFEIKIPIRKLLLLNKFLDSVRVLDSWVIRNLSVAKNNFSRKPTVKQRETHINLPISINDKVLEELSVNDLKAHFKKDICSLLIHGEGGAGKTHLACQIAKWCLNEEKELNVLDHPSIPVIIEDDLSPSNNDQNPFIQVIGGQLRLIIDSADKVPQELLIKLLAKKRVLVIVDHLSEMNEFTRSVINSYLSDPCVNAMIVTSRIKENLGGITPLLLNPLRIKKGHLRHFVDAYLRKRNQLDLFDDLELGEVLNRLSKIVGDRDITILMCKLYADQLIAYKKGEMDNLPENVPDLMLQYLNELNRNVKDGRIDDPEVHKYAKIIAWLSLEQNFSASYVSEDLILKKLDEKNPKEKLKYLIDKLRILKVIEPAKDKVRFVLDPIAEYFAGLYVVENFKDDQWQELIMNIESSNEKFQKISGFVYALNDCCQTRSYDSNIPSHVIDALDKLTT